MWHSTDDQGPVVVHVQAGARECGERRRGPGLDPRPPDPALSLRLTYRHCHTSLTEVCTSPKHEYPTGHGHKGTPKPPTTREPHVLAPLANLDPTVYVYTQTPDTPRASDETPRPHPLTPYLGCVGRTQTDTPRRLSHCPSQPDLLWCTPGEVKRDPRSPGPYRVSFPNRHRSDLRPTLRLTPGAHWCTPHRYRGTTTMSHDTSTIPRITHVSTRNSLRTHPL